MTHSWAYPPHYYVIWGGRVPANLNVTIYSDDSFMGVPPYDVIYVVGVPANQNVIIYSDDSFMGVPPPTITSYGGGSCQSKCYYI